MQVLGVFDYVVEQKFARVHVASDNLNSVELRFPLPQDSTILLGSKICLRPAQVQKNLEQSRFILSCAPNQRLL